MCRAVACVVQSVLNRMFNMLTYCFSKFETNYVLTSLDESSIKGRPANSKVSLEKLGDPWRCHAWNHHRDWPQIKKEELDNERSILTLRGNFKLA